MRVMRLYGSGDKVHSTRWDTLLPSDSVLTAFTMAPPITRLDITRLEKRMCKEDGTVYHMSRAARHERTGPSRRRARR